MNGITFLVILAIALIIGIILIFIFQTYNFISLKSYHEKWEPIYENRKEHFDCYLQEALDNSKSTETVLSVARLAARLRLEDEVKDLKGYEHEEYELHYDSNLERYINEYEHELRSANIG